MPRHNQDAGVTLREVGPNGGQAAAFAYDLAASVVLTRQVSQERDGVAGVRPNDLFYGASATDPQPVDTTKIRSPQADDASSSNLITS